jgi:hypothetical protein
MIHCEELSDEDKAANSFRAGAVEAPTQEQKMKLESDRPCQ